MGGAGNDYLEGGFGADVLDGGTDDGYDRGPTESTRDNFWGDTVGYLRSDAGVTVNLATGTAEGGHAEGDTLTRIESVRGSHHADVLTARDDDPSTENHNNIPELSEGSILWGNRGDDLLQGGTGRDILWGGKGDDTLLGGASRDVLEGGFGADVLDGGDGDDWVQYDLSDAGVIVNLATGTAQGGHAEGDTLTGFEHLGGSQYADQLTSDAGNNYLWGGGGADTIDGGAGFDLAFYTLSDAGVTIDLATGTIQGGSAEGDTLTGIEGLYGSMHGDHLSGDAEDSANLYGWFGDDTLEGGAGYDYLEGGAGADMVDGGEGNDIAGYWESDAGVTVNLATGTAQGGHAEGDTLTGIESIYGSDHADHLTGDSGDNTLLGKAGNDTLDGGAGSDFLNGRAGEDLLTGGEGCRHVRFRRWQYGYGFPRRQR